MRRVCLYIYVCKSLNIMMKENVIISVKGIGTRKILMKLCAFRELEVDGSLKFPACFNWFRFIFQFIHLRRVVVKLLFYIEVFWNATQYSTEVVHNCIAFNQILYHIMYCTYLFTHIRYAILFNVDPQINWEIETLNL